MEGINFYYIYIHLLWGEKRGINKSEKSLKQKMLKTSKSVFRFSIEHQVVYDKKRIGKLIKLYLLFQQYKTLQLSKLILSRYRHSFDYREYLVLQFFIYEGSSNFKEFYTGMG